MNTEKTDNEKADQYLLDHIEEAKIDHDKAVDLYREYVGKAETPEERLRRIHNFRCGGKM